MARVPGFVPSVLAWAASLYAIVQAIGQWSALTLDDGERSACGVAGSEALLTALTVVLCVTAVSALGLAGSSRPRAASVAVVIVALLAALWLALDGATAAGCAIE